MVLETSRPRAARERTCGDDHVGQHVDSQDVDVTKALHCTFSVSSALASGDAGERTQVRTVENKEESTAAIPLQVKRADPQRVEKSNHCGKERTYS